MYDSYFFVKEFNKRTRKKIWLNKSTEIKKVFREKLEVLEFKVKRGHNISMKSYLQVGIGYNGLGTSFMSGVQTKASLGLNSDKTVGDHLIGALKIGEFVLDEFRKNNYNIDYMVDTWLKNHLFLWAKIKVTKEEHRKDNILRNSDHTIEQKLNLEHYINVSELV